MIFRFFAAALLVYAFGFLGFAVSLPKPVAGEPTDAVVVLTGGPGRIARGLAVVEQGLAKEMFVSGVDPEVRPAEFAAEFSAWLSAPFEGPESKWLPEQRRRPCSGLGVLDSIFTAFMSCSLEFNSTLHVHTCLKHHSLLSFQMRKYYRNIL